MLNEGDGETMKYIIDYHFVILLHDGNHFTFCTDIFKLKKQPTEQAKSL